MVVRVVDRVVDKPPVETDAHQHRNMEDFMRSDDTRNQNWLAEEFEYCAERIGQAAIDERLDEGKSVSIPQCSTRDEPQ